MQLGDYDKALIHLESAGNSTRNLVDILQVYYLKKDKEKSEDLYNKIIGISKVNYVSDYRWAEIYMAIGDKQRAASSMAGAYDINDGFFSWILIEPSLAPLPDDPKIVELLKRSDLLFRR